MTRQFRIPGPLGRSPIGGGGRLPGPLRVIPSIFAAPNQIAKATSTKKLGMPRPATAADDAYVHDYSWKLFAKDKTPAFADVEQGVLHNCALASVLAALAHTSTGRKHILSLAAEHSAVVETDVSGVANPPSGNKITSNRYFTVKLGGKLIEVSGVLYTSDHDRGWVLSYMRSPTDVLWPCVIEKAFAEKVGGYGELDGRFAKDGKGLTANAIWEVVVGSKPGGFLVTDKTANGKIMDAVKDASKIPTIAGSKDDAVDLTGDHGFAVLGMSGSKIDMYDPNTVERKTLSLKEFRKNFEFVLHGSS